MLQRRDGCRLESHPISSSRAFSSGELKKNILRRLPLLPGSHLGQNFDRIGQLFGPSRPLAYSLSQQVPILSCNYCQHSEHIPLLYAYMVVCQKCFKKVYHCIDWLQSLKQCYLNVSYHILEASHTLMALFLKTEPSE